MAISGADSRGILEEPLPSTSSEEEDPLAGELHVCPGHPGIVLASSGPWHGNAHQPNSSIQVEGMYVGGLTIRGVLVWHNEMGPALGVKLILAHSNSPTLPLLPFTT